MADKELIENDYYPEVIEFLKLTRTLYNQIKIMSKLDIPEAESDILINASKNLLNNIELYLGQGE